MPKYLPLLILILNSSLVAAQDTGSITPIESAEPGRKKLDSCQVIARIDNHAILASDILWEANMIIADNADRIPADQVDKVRGDIVKNQLRNYIDTKLIYADFRRSAQGADMNSIRAQLDDPFYNGGTSGESPGSVPGLMKALKVQSMTDLEVKLAELGTSLVDRKEAYIEKAIAQTWVQQKVDVDKPTYAQLSQYYQDHLEDYAFPTQARWEELVVRFSNHSDKQAAKKKIVQIGNLAWQAKQQSPGSSEPLFDSIARQHSEAYNAKEGGLNDWTTRGALVNETIDHALFTLPVGELSPIIETDKGFHIVRVVERREAGHTPFAEVQDAIREKMMNEQFREKTENYISQLRHNTRIWTMYSGNTTAEAFLSPPDANRRR